MCSYMVVVAVIYVTFPVHTAQQRCPTRLVLTRAPYEMCMGSKPFPRSLCISYVYHEQMCKDCLADESMWKVPLKTEVLKTIVCNQVATVAAQEGQGCGFLPFTLAGVGLQSKESTQFRS